MSKAEWVDNKKETTLLGTQVQSLNVACAASLKQRQEEAGDRYTYIQTRTAYIQLTS